MIEFVKETYINANDNDDHFHNHASYYMLPRFDNRSFFLSALRLCVSGTAFAVNTIEQSQLSNKDTLIVTTTRTGSRLRKSPASLQAQDNATSISIADSLKDIPGVEVTDNTVADTNKAVYSSATTGFKEPAAAWRHKRIVIVDQAIILGMGSRVTDAVESLHQQFWPQ